MCPLKCPSFAMNAQALREQLVARSYKVFEARPKLVPDASEGGQSVLFRALYGRGIFYAPMDALRLGWKDRTALFGAIADCDHVVEILARKLHHRLGAMSRNINPDLTANGNSFGPYPAWFCAGAKNLIRRASVVSKEPLRHLATSRVPRAKDENTLSVIHGFSGLSAGIVSGLAWGTKTAEAPYGNDGMSHRKSNVAVPAPAN
jgi:hypothetical protein